MAAWFALLITTANALKFTHQQTRFCGFFHSIRPPATGGLFSRSKMNLDDLHEQLRAAHERALLTTLARRLPRYWLSRLIVALEVLIMVVIVSWFEEDSLTGKALTASGNPGWVLLGVLGFFCMVAIADVVVNDLMPDRFRLPTAIRLRHLGFMGMSLALGAIGVLVAFEIGFTTLIFVYWLNALLAAGLTYLDAFARFR